MKTSRQLGQILRLLAVVSVAACLVPTSLQAAIFARFEGIDGESKDSNHEGWIDILSIDWGVHRAGGVAPSHASGLGELIIGDFMMAMNYDRASPKLADKCLRGEVIPKLEIELTATYGGSRATYLRYEFRNVIITSYQVNASGNDEAGPPTVLVGNNFEEIKVVYTEYDSEGGLKGNVEYEWKVEKGEAAARVEDADPAEEP